MKLTIKTHFDAAHYLLNYNGPCANLHGHRWEVRITVEGKVDYGTGMVLDFKVLKAAINNTLPDHKCLNDLYTFNPTAENLVEYLFNTLDTYCAMYMPGITLKEVELWETPECSVIYGGVLNC